MGRILLIGAWMATLAFSQSVIRNVQQYGLTHSSIRWTFEADLPCTQVKFGLSPGNYSYRSGYYCTSDPRKSMAVGGLAPGTTYYFRMTARPNENDEVGICQTDTCGSTEFVIATPAAPAIHPQLPEPPKRWVPTHPDTSNYYIVPMILGGKNGTECVAASSVPAARVNAGDDIETILNAIPYGTVLEFPQGIECQVDPTRNRGYRLPTKPPDSVGIDSPQHKWIVFRTAAGSPVDFPPFGSRTGESWAPKLAKFIAVKPTESGLPGLGHAQLFGAEEIGGQHHFWFENLEFTTTKDPQFLPPPDAMDPPPFSVLFSLFPAFPSTVPPDIAYIVLDRIYIHGRKYPSRHTRGVTLGGRNQAMIGCVMEDLDFWEVGVTPNQVPVLSANQATLTVPPVSFARNSHDVPTGISQTAVITLQASQSYQGNYAMQLGPQPGMLKILYSSPGPDATVNIQCSGCTAEPQESPQAAYNAYRYCSGSIGNGRFSTPACNTDFWQTTSYGYGWGTIGLDLVDGGTGPYYIDNNFLGAVGMGLYVDGGGWAVDSTNNISYANNSNNDVSFLRNHMMWSEDHRITSSYSNGFRYPVRNLFENKRGKRWLIQGNLFQNYWTFQNDGSAILLAGAYAPFLITTEVSGVLDQTIVSNIIRHGATGIQSHGPFQEYPAAEQPGNILIENNLMYDLAAHYKYSDQVLSLVTSLFFIGGSRDMTIRHNTAGLTLGDLPAWMFGDTSGIIMEGLSFTDNILYYSLGGQGGGVRIGEARPALPRLPPVDESNYKTVLNTAFVRTGTTVVPDYTFERNVIIGGKTYPGAGDDQKDMTNAQIQAASTLLPNNYFPIASSETMAAREKLAGLVDPANGNYRLSSTSPYRATAIDGKAAGADQDRLIADTGLVTNISVSRIAGGAVFNYTAPDEKACVVDTTVDNQNWTRTTDSGGPRNRIVNVTLSSSVTAAQYRVLCYYQQVNRDLLYTDYLGDQITDGQLPPSPLSAPLRRR